VNTPPAWDGRPQDLNASSDSPGARDESAGRPLRALTARSARRFGVFRWWDVSVRADRESVGSL